jgi:hypothetical protein
VIDVHLVIIISLKTSIIIQSFSVDKLVELSLPAAAL